VITILSTGTRGDTQPYIALGLALEKAGQHVRIAAFENYEAFVKSYGLEFFPIKGDVSKAAASLNAQDAMQADNPLKFLLSFNKLQSMVFDLQKDFFEACTGADAVVYHPGAAIGYFAARHLKIPSILATPFPMTPTRDYPSLIFYDKIRLGKRFNLLTHQIIEQTFWFASSAPIKQFWKAQFGKAPKNFSNPYPNQRSPTGPTIVSCSNYVFPRPADWPADVHNTGYWFLEDEAGWEAPAELLAFLQKGPAPIYVGFGSVGNPEQAIQTTALVIDALKRAGQRGVLATGWSGMSKNGDIPAGIFMLESAPHTWLFPRMTAVVHHGGAGTTSAGLRAGVPGIIIPHSNDQFAWGRRVYELGAGSKPIPRKKLTAEKMAEAINFALTDPIRDTAKDLGVKIRSENGAERAAEVIIRCLEQKGDASPN
jgi:sterol 3beta-glucosyltransferase